MLNPKCARITKTPQRMEYALIANYVGHKNVTRRDTSDRVNETDGFQDCEKTLLYFSFFFSALTRSTVRDWCSTKNV